jgi:hypothetical protein
VMASFPFCETLGDTTTLRVRLKIQHATKLFSTLEAGKVEEFLAQSLAGEDTASIDTSAISKWLQVRSAAWAMWG